MAYVFDVQGEQGDLALQHVFRKLLEPRLSVKDEDEKKEYSQQSRSRGEGRRLTAHLDEGHGAHHVDGIGLRRQREHHLSLLLLLLCTLHLLLVLRWLLLVVLLVAPRAHAYNVSTEVDEVGAAPQHPAELEADAFDYQLALDKRHHPEEQL